MNDFCQLNSFNRFFFFQQKAHIFLFIVRTGTVRRYEFDFKRNLRNGKCISSVDSRLNFSILLAQESFMCGPSLGQRIVWGFFRIEEENAFPMGFPVLEFNFFNYVHTYVYDIAGAFSFKEGKLNLGLFQN